MAFWTGRNRASITPRLPLNAQVAQLVEHATENRSVGGSIPPLGTTSILNSIVVSHLGLKKCPTFLNRRVKWDTFVLFFVSRNGRAMALSAKDYLVRCSRVPCNLFRGSMARDRHDFVFAGSKLC